MKHKNINKFYLYSLCHSLVFAYVIERLFWASRGMRIIDVIYIEIIYSGIVLLLELPTGMFADRFSRKTWIVFDAVMALAEFAILIFATDFWHFAAAIALSATGHAFQSGAHNALLYDSLADTNDTDIFEKVLGRIKAVDYTGSLIGGLIGAVIATYYPLVTTYWLSLISLVLALIVSITIVEVKVITPGEAWTVKDWLEIVRFIFNKKSIRLMAIVGMVTGAVTTFVDEFWQIYLEAVEVPVLYFGAFEIIAFGSVALGSLMAYKHKEKFGLKVSIESMILLATVSLFVLFFFREWYIIVLIGAVYYGVSVIEPLIYGYLHDHAIEKYRATIESAYSFIEMFAVMVLGMPFGFISTSYNIFYGFLYLAIILTLLSVAYLIVGRKIKFD